VCAEFECAIPGTVFTGDADLWRTISIKKSKGFDMQCVEVS
jgi:hypothetical protein